MLLPWSALSGSHYLASPVDWGVLVPVLEPGMPAPDRSGLPVPACMVQKLLADCPLLARAVSLASASFIYRSPINADPGLGRKSLSSLPYKALTGGTLVSLSGVFFSWRSAQHPNTK